MSVATFRTARPRSMVEIAAEIRALDRRRTLDHVADDLRQIQRDTTGSASPGRRQLARDGVGCFNLVYLTVTERIGVTPDFEHRAFVDRLAVVFAEFYLLAYEAESAGEGYVSKAWQPLFERRRDGSVAPLQFAIAGMNAHINNDLSWALIQVWDEFGVTPHGDSPEHRDFDLVNGVLAAAQQEVRSRLQSGFLRWLDRALGRVDDRVAGFSIAVAREDAWRRGIDLNERPELKQDTRHERQVGFQSHLILEPRLDFLDR